MVSCYDINMTWCMSGQCLTQLCNILLKCRILAEFNSMPCLFCVCIKTVCACFFVHSIFCDRPIPISIAAVPQAVSTANVPGSRNYNIIAIVIHLLRPTYIWFYYISGQTVHSTLEFESVAAVATLNMHRLAEMLSAFVSEVM